MALKLKSPTNKSIILSVLAIFLLLLIFPAALADYPLIISGGYSGDLRKSSDSGATWDSLGMTGTWRSVSMSSNAENAIAAKNLDGVYYSDDYGQTWTNILAVTDVTSVDCSETCQDMIVLSNSGDIFFSNNYGATFNNISTVLSTPWITSISLDGQKMIASDGERLYRSTTSGASWDYINVSGYYGIDMDGDGGKLLANDWNDDFLYLSTDFGDSWSLIFDNTSSLSSGSYVSISDNGQNLVGSYGDGYVVSNDGGSTWSKTLLAAKGSGQEIGEVADNYFYLCDATDLDTNASLYSNDGGISWNTITDPTLCASADIGIVTPTITPPTSQPSRQRSSPLTGGAVVTTSFLDSSFLQTTVTWRIMLLIAIIVIAASTLLYVTVFKPK